MSIDRKIWLKIRERFAPIQWGLFEEAIEAYEAAKASEPVTVSLEKCVKAMDQVAHETFSGYIEYEPHDFAKAVLDAAGVKYVD